MNYSSLKQEHNKDTLSALFNLALKILTKLFEKRKKDIHKEREENKTIMFHKWDENLKISSNLKITRDSKWKHKKKQDITQVNLGEFSSLQ